MNSQVKIEIRNRFTGIVIFESTSEENTIKKAVIEAIQCGADLRDANLCDANLRGADLCGADLRDANLCDANLCDANLCDANLCDANLRGADLRGADLRDANLCDANLCDANLRDANLASCKGAYLSCPSFGKFVGWKKASGFIVKLEIPEDARRSSATGDKCRCDKAYVLEIQNIDGTKADVESVRSDHDRNFVYVVGATVEVPDFNENRWEECTSGIHFFIDRRAAVEY